MDDENFLRYYQIPNIESQTIAGTIKDALIRFNLSPSVLKGQTYDGASNMMGNRSEVVQEIKKDQRKDVETLCHGHTLSVKDMTKNSKLVNVVIGTVEKITVLVKYSPKRDQWLGSIQSDKECDDDDESFEKATTLKIFV